jgi:hypothetical protein
MYIHTYIRTIHSLGYLNFGGEKVFTGRQVARVFLIPKREFLGSGLAAFTIEDWKTE